MSDESALRRVAELEAELVLAKRPRCGDCGTQFDREEDNLVTVECCDKLICDDCVQHVRNEEINDERRQCERCTFEADVEDLKTALDEARKNAQPDPGIATRDGLQLLAALKQYAPRCVVQKIDGSGLCGRPATRVGNVCDACNIHGALELPYADVLRRVSESN